MSLTSELEEKYGFQLDKLSSVDKETYFSMLDAVQKSQLSVDRLRDYIVAMKESVEKELINEPEFNWVFIFKVPNRKQILLKARLQNYLLLEAFLISPEKARERLEDMIKGMMKGGVSYYA